MPLWSDDVRVDTATFESAMNRWIALKRITLREGLRRQAGLLADELVRDTPPEKGRVGSRTFGARKAGEARAERDIQRAVRPLDPRTFRSEGLADAIREKRYDVIQKALPNFRIQPFAPDLHRKAQDRDGRVRRPTLVATPDHVEHAAYVREIKQRVGLAKGGWVAAQQALGRQPQSWLLTHAWVGRCVDRTDAPEPHVSMVNNADWAQGRLAGIIVNRALTRREGRMERDIAGILAARARKVGLA